MSETYLLIREGEYERGVFWVGSDPEIGKRQADTNAQLDIDDYHKWNLYMFVTPIDLSDDPKHKLVYTGVKQNDH